MEAADRPYVDRPVADLDAATEAARRAATTFGTAEPRLHRRGMNAIYAAGDVMLRVGCPTAPAAVSIALADRLLAAGIRVARPARRDTVEERGMAVTAWERIEPSGEPVDWAAVGAMVRALHGLPAETVPAGYPLPSPASFPWWDFDRLLAETDRRLDAAARAGLVAAIERHRGWPRFAEATVVCHGDVHPGNVVMAADGPVLLDWDLLCRAPRGWDHAPLMTWTARWGGAAGIYEAFADGYGWSARGDPATEAFAELRLVAATLMRVRAAATDRHAREEAERRLRYWRGEPAAPPWRAQ